MSEGEAIGAFFGLCLVCCCELEQQSQRQAAVEKARRDELMRQRREDERLNEYKRLVECSLRNAPAAPAAASVSAAPTLPCTACRKQLVLQQRGDGLFGCAECGAVQTEERPSGRSAPAAPCVQCSRSLSADDTFCSKCGHRVGQPRVVEAAAPQFSADAEPPAYFAETSLRTPLVSAEHLREPGGNIAADQWRASAPPARDSQSFQF